MSDWILQLVHNRRPTSPEPENAGIAISTRLRLARNLAGMVFPRRADKKQLKHVFDLVQHITEDPDMPSGTRAVDIDKLDRIDRMVLIERRLISPDLARMRTHRALYVDSAEISSAMINEEDHLRLQIMHPGLWLSESWPLADRLDGIYEKHLDYAYNPDFGYLTACPTNCGTGMRASVMLHLPALAMAGRIGPVLHAVNQLGLTARGLYGEGTESMGNLFQVSNQWTLGRSETQILQAIESMVRQIIDREHAEQEILITEGRTLVEDKVGRAYGILSNARIISSRELLELVSDLRLGIDLGIVKGITHAAIEEIIMCSQPAHLQKLAGKALDAPERDRRRSDLIRKIIQSS